MIASFCFFVALIVDGVSIVFSPCSSAIYGIVSNEALCTIKHIYLAGVFITVKIKFVKI